MSSAPQKRPNHFGAPPPATPLLLQLAIGLAAATTLAYWALRLGTGIVPSVVQAPREPTSLPDAESQLSGIDADSWAQRQGTLIPPASRFASAAEKQQTARLQELAANWEQVLLVTNAMELAEHELLGTLRDVNAALWPNPKSEPYREFIQAALGRFPAAAQEMVRKLDDRMQGLPLNFSWVRETLKTRDPQFTGWTTLDESRLVGGRALVQEARQLRRDMQAGLQAYYGRVPESAWPPR